MPMPWEPLPRWRWMVTDPRARAEHPGTRFYTHVYVRVYTHNSFPLEGPACASLRSCVSFRKGPGAWGFRRAAVWLFGWATAGCPCFPSQRWLRSTPSCRSEDSVYPMAPVSSEDSALSYTANSWLQRGCVLGAANWQLQGCVSLAHENASFNTQPSAPPRGVLTRELGSDRWLFSKRSFRENIPPR